MDSDAMIQMNIDDIIKNYDFFSVASSYCPGAIFQGFIGSIPNHVIIYEALRDAYNIDVVKLSKQYNLLVKNLYTIVNNIVSNDNFNGNIKLYSEKVNDKFSGKICNDEGETICIHYYEHKIIPE